MIYNSNKFDIRDLIKNLIFFGLKACGENGKPVALVLKYLAEF